MDAGALLRRIDEGDQSAWNELIDHFGGLVWSVARGFRLGASTDDVVQTVWLRLAEFSDRIREPEHLAAWLATTTRNEAMRVSRRDRAAVSLDVLPDVSEPTTPGVEEMVADDDTLRRVLTAFAELPENDQRLLRLLCTVPPLDYETIARLLGRSKGSIGPTRERCLQRLRQLLPSTSDGRPRTGREGGTGDQ